MTGLAQEIHAAIREVREAPRPGSPEAEAASDALLVSAHAYNDGAHSERKDTDYNRKHSRGREHTKEGETSAMELVVDGYVEAEEIIIAASAGLSTRALCVWQCCDQEGMSQERVAAALGLSERSINRILSQARQDLRSLIESNVRYVFKLDIHDKINQIYHPPTRRPLVPETAEEARYRLEERPGISTHILPEDLGAVEVWVNDERPVVETPGGRETPIGRKSLQALVKQGRRIRHKRLVKIRAKRLAEQVAADNCELPTAAG